MADDRHDVANLLHTNVILNDPVANLTKKVTERDTQIDELSKSTLDLSVTIRALANNQGTPGCSGGQG
eukprot:7432744-Ditylum_brightwellii.AAC.1